MKISEIKVLNIAQPNAHYIMFDGKNVENRTMTSSYRGTIAIYASKTYQKSLFEDQEITKEDCSFGCIVGFADIVDCIVEEEVTKKTKEWFCGPYGYILENIRPLKEPIAVTPPKGAIIWWTLKGANVQKCLSQISLKSFIPVEKIAPNPNKPKVKNSRRGPQNPSKSLAAIIGSEPISLNKALGKFADYINENDLAENDDEPLIIPDKKIKKLTTKKKLTLKDCYELVQSNLSRE